ncbi:MAG: ribonuclease HIII [Chlamydiae bacterium]|nr:ribonuclease HIII [Chlamydiota bacterium]MBI3276750.1 ribonuclease HIII [Chlamydiota bacterium]
MPSNTRNYYVCQVGVRQSSLLKALLEEKGFQFREVPYAEWGAFTQDVHVVLYSKGKLVIQGKGTQDFVQFFLEPQILKEIKFGYEGELAMKEGVSHIGVDESGKGDFFGPLVIAAAYVKKEKIGKLIDEGVKDSKKLTSQAINRLSKLVRDLCPHALVVINPDRYNTLYEKIKNLNRLLAWGHARSIENLLSKVDCSHVILDQFGSEHLVLNALMEKGKKVSLKQMHHGEEDVAVAAASILARHEFLKRMEELGKKIGMELPRGAGFKVIEVATTLFQKEGLEGLSKIAKIHFKIVDKMNKN